MGHKLKITGWVALGVVAGALTTVSLQTVARNTLAPLPLEEVETPGATTIDALAEVIDIQAKDRKRFKRLLDEVRQTMTVA